MFNAIITKILGSKNERDLKTMQPIVARMNEIEPQMQRLSDIELAGITPKFRERLAGGETLDNLLPEAFAAVREAAKRTLRMRHYDVQLVGGIALKQGKIDDTETDQSKTQVATRPAYLYALEGKGVH